MMENLPMEILLKIFDYCDSETVKSASNVCQRFQSIIHNDVAMMNKFTISINLSNLHTIKTESSDMPYRKFELVASKYYNQMLLSQFYGKVMSVLDEHLENIESLRLCEITSGLATKILQKLPNLTHLNIDKVIKSGMDEDDMEIPVNLPNLKQLKMIGADSYLKCIKSNQVEVLKIYDEPTQKLQSLNNFLRRSPNLKYLALIGKPLTFETEKFKFKLDKLKIRNFFTSIEEEHENPMVQLMQSQKDNIKDLKVTGFVTQKILETAINYMKNLVKFKVDLGKIFAEPKYLTVNRTLKHLELINLPNFQEHAMKIITKCPAVETLKILSEISQQFLAEISNSMKNLQHMTLKSVTDLIHRPLSFVNLKSLTILEVMNVIQPCNIIKISEASPNLFEIYIANAVHEVEPELLKNLIQSSKKMEILRISGNVVFDMDTLEVLREIDTDLKVLWLDIEADDDNYENVEILKDTNSNLQIIIPEHNALENYEDYFEEDMDLGFDIEELIREIEEEGDVDYDVSSDENGSNDEEDSDSDSEESEFDDDDQHSDNSEILTFVLGDDEEYSDDGQESDGNSSDTDEENSSRTSKNIGDSLKIQIGVQKRQGSNGSDDDDDECALTIKISREKSGKIRKIC